MLRATVNGQSHELQENCTILQALRSIGIDIPTLCDDSRLNPYGACRLCVVALEGVAHPVTSCHTPLADGMIIETDRDEIRHERRGVLRLLAHRYPREAIRQFPGKPLPRYLIDHSLEDEAAAVVNSELVDDSHPYLHVDMSRCVACYRCVRICEEV